MNADAPGSAAVGHARAVVRVAAAADLHLRPDAPRRFRNSFETAAQHADLLLVAGDLTASGQPAEARMAAQDLRNLGIPVIVALGNHDLAGKQPKQVVDTLTEAGITVLHGTSTVLDVRGTSVGIAGTVGFGGGFGPSLATKPGARQLKAFVRHSEQEAALLRAALGQVADADVRIALTHYAPHPSTLLGESLELYPFLGCSRLGDVIDEANQTAGVAVGFHGHAHHGTEKGTTDGGVPLRNVAKPVLGNGHRVYLLRHTGGRWQLDDTRPPSKTPTPRARAMSP